MNYSCVNAFTRIQTIIAVLLIVLIVSTGLIIISLDLDAESAPFSMEIVTNSLASMMGEKNLPVAIPEQKILLLVAIEDDGEGKGKGEEVIISAIATDAQIIVSNPKIKSDEVAEVIVIPSKNSLTKNLTINFEGKRNDYAQTKTVEYQILDLQDELGETATQMQNRFIPWLATNHPELNISNNTEWTGTIVNPGILVVMHYMFYNDDWEMYLTWHVMIPPYDWARIYLRPRFTETQSTLAFEISSLQGQEQPHSISPEDSR